MHTETSATTTVVKVQHKEQRRQSLKVQLISSLTLPTTRAYQAVNLVGIEEDSIRENERKCVCCTGKIDKELKDEEERKARNNVKDR